MTPDKEAVLKQMQYIADAISDPIQKMRAEKQIAIYSIGLSVAEQITHQLKHLPSSKKKILKKINRRPFKKKKTASVLSKIMFDAYMGSIQMNIIAAAPIPKYPTNNPKSGYYLGNVFVPLQNEQDMITDHRELIDGIKRRPLI